jgi:hypothetical protein
MTCDEFDVHKGTLRFTLQNQLNKNLYIQDRLHDLDYSHNKFIKSYLLIESGSVS